MYAYLNTKNIKCLDYLTLLFFSEILLAESRKCLKILAYFLGIIW